MTKTTGIIFVTTFLLIASGTLGPFGDSRTRCVAGGPGGKSRYRSSERNSTQANGPRRGLLDFGGLLKSKGGGEKSASPLADVPLERLTRAAQDRINEITGRPTLVRKLPQQTIACDPELFLFLARKPDTIIGIWDLMGITKVKTRRTGPYQFEAIDGSGTSCAVDLIYGDHNLHLFIAEGEYDGKFVQKPVRGRGLFVLKHQYRQAADGTVNVVGTLDCYVKFESLGADLIARSLGGLIGKSADHNFAETAKFISQISSACRTNPEGLAELVTQMKQVDPEMRREFTSIIAKVARRSRQAPMLQPPRAPAKLARRDDTRANESRLAPRQ